LRTPEKLGLGASSLDDTGRGNAGKRVPLSCKQATEKGKQEYTTITESSPGSRAVPGNKRETMVMEGIRRTTGSYNAAWSARRQANVQSEEVPLTHGVRVVGHGSRAAEQEALA